MAVPENRDDDAVAADGAVVLEDPNAGVEALLFPVDAPKENVELGALVDCGAVFAVPNPVNPEEDLDSPNPPNDAAFPGAVVLLLVVLELKLNAGLELFPLPPNGLLLLLLLLLLEPKLKPDAV